MQQPLKSDDRSRSRNLKSSVLVAGAVALAPAAFGGTIVTVPVNEVVSYDGPSYDLTASGGPDLTFSIPVQIGGGAPVDVSGGLASYALDPVTLFPLESQPGDTIGPSNTFATATDMLTACEPGPGCSGEFPSDGETHYLGFEFSPGAGTDYGYVDLSISGGTKLPPQLTLESFTYDTSGAPITITATPEPSAFLMLAAGAAGIAALRARRKARR